MKNNVLVLILLSMMAIGAYFAYVYSQSRVSSVTEDTLQKEKNITLGWIGPLTGKTQSLGVDGLNTIQFVIETYNENKEPGDPKINLLVADVPLGSTAALQAYRDMLQKKAKLFFVLTSEDTIALSKYAKKDGIIIINPLNNDDTMTNLSPNVFLIAKRTGLLFVPVINLMLKKNEHTVFVLYSTSESFNVALAKYFEAAFTAAGGKAIMRSYSARTVTDFGPLLQEGIRNKANAYVFFGAAEMGRAIKQARAMNIQAPMYAGNYINSPDAHKEGGYALDNIIFTDFTYRDGHFGLAKSLLHQFEEKFRRKPYLEWTVLQAYDAINLTLDAIHFASLRAGVFDQKVRDFFMKVRDYEGVSGNITIRPDGSSEGIIPGLYIFKNGKAEKIER